jgi:two-component system nitrogen regulation sensor histidine kinase NtrY
MRLRRKFLIFAVLVHAIFVVLSILLLSYNKYLFAAAELLILISFSISVYLYRAFLKPLNLIAAGVESIKDQDFSTKFVNTGQDELGQLVSVYNQMIDQLRQERVRQQEQHYFLQRLIEATPIAVIILDLDNHVDMLNAAARSLLGIAADEPASHALEGLPAPLGPILQEMKDGETQTVTVSGTQTYKCLKSHFLDRGFHRSFILIEELTKEIIASQKKAFA